LGEPVDPAVVFDLAEDWLDDRFALGIELMAFPLWLALRASSVPSLDGVGRVSFVGDCQG
jgi:hypothetical protein